MYISWTLGSVRLYVIEYIQGSRTGLQPHMVLGVTLCSGAKS